MIRKLHFVTGLPRAGSTLLAALLRQNPHFHAGMTSPVRGPFSGMLDQFSGGSEFGPVLDRDTRRRLLRGLFEFAERNTQLYEFLGEPCLDGPMGEKLAGYRAQQGIDGR